MTNMGVPQSAGHQIVKISLFQNINISMPFRDFYFKLLPEPSPNGIRGTGMPVTLWSSGKYGGYINRRPPEAALSRPRSDVTIGAGCWNDPDMMQQ